MIKNQPRSINSQDRVPLTWLITGGCGFIGTNLVARLLEDNHKTRLRVLDNLSVGTKEDLAEVCSFQEKAPYSLKGKPENVELVVGDIKDDDTCLHCCEGVDIVVHLAASTGVPSSVENPRKDMETNVIGTFNILEASRRTYVKKFIFASSGAPVGECDPPINEEVVPHPVSPYGASKLAGEAYCSAYFRTFGIEAVALRFGNVYGPRSTHKGSVVAKFIQQALRGELLEIYGDGKQTRDFIYIQDLVEGILSAVVEDGVGGHVFQIATSAETTVNELLDTLIPILKESGIEHVETSYSAPRLGDVRRNFSDISKAKRVLGWQARVSLPVGLKKTLEWFMHFEP